MGHDCWEVTTGHDQWEVKTGHDWWEVTANSDWFSFGARFVVYPHWPASRLKPPPRTHLSNFAVSTSVSEAIYTWSETFMSCNTASRVSDTKRAHLVASKLSVQCLRVWRSYWDLTKVLQVKSWSNKDSPVSPFVICTTKGQSRIRQNQLLCSTTTAHSVDFANI